MGYKALTGPQGPPGGSLNFQQIAALHWYEANEAGNTVNVGSFTSGIIFDGEHIWTASQGTGDIVEVDPATGAVLASYPTGGQPEEMAYDGANIWVALYYSNAVAKIQASTGTILGTYSVDSSPDGVAFDGSHIWVVNQGSNNVTELAPSTGATVGTFPVGSSPLHIVSDGTNLWVDNSLGNSVTEFERIYRCNPRHLFSRTLARGDRVRWITYMGE